MIKQYETVFILTPVLSDDQLKEAVEKYRELLKENKCEIVNEESWGLRKLAYAIKKKSTGFYQLFEFKAEPTFIDKLELTFRRDERILRFMTFNLDKDAVAYSVKRREKLAGKKKEKVAEQ
jgi:small subunit ribosomal protein S6